MVMHRIKIMVEFGNGGDVKRVEGIRINPASEKQRLREKFGFSGLFTW